jgi:adenine/guanine phosphoribosyltransferase-like PRPP-binding protein
LVELALEFEPEAIVGIPTLGLTYARGVAGAIGLSDYVALGNSRKFWYDDSSSAPVVSVTSPEAQKSLYLDPSLVERVSGKRTLIVDDVMNTGATAAAAVQLLQQVKARLMGIVVVLTEGHDWENRLAKLSPDLPQQVRRLGHIPMFERTPTGWMPIPQTL